MEELDEHPHEQDHVAVLLAQMQQATPYLDITRVTYRERESSREKERDIER